MFSNRRYASRLPKTRSIIYIQLHLTRFYLINPFTV
nr:MAG TPA: hypothetical protein [Caudoviricetes sp.]